MSEQEAEYSIVAGGLIKAKIEALEQRVRDLESENHKLTQKLNEVIDYVDKQK
jgi:outer membrane murein-binding lipoprotein Lpp